MNGRVIIVGRTNVGKSSLFNRLVGKRKAIVEDVPGVTRDMIEGRVDWKGKTFTLVDTGGLVTGKVDKIIESIRNMVGREIQKADVILFVVDGGEGINPLDQEIAKLLMRLRERVLLVVNKVDTEKEERSLGDFYSLGFDKVFPVSAIHGRGTGELLDELVKYIPDGEAGTSGGIKLAFVGKPNTGKSSLINAILGHERVIVSPLPGTTRDVVEVPFNWKNRDFILLDTAGVRRRTKISHGVEFYSVGRTIRAIEDSDVCCLVIDASERISRQDKRIGGLIERRGRGCVIVVNKMDLSPISPKEWEKVIGKELFFLDYAPVVFTVAIEGKGIEELLSAVAQIFDQMSRKVSTSFLMKCVEKILRKKPPVHRGKVVKVFYAFQKGVLPPTFVLITNKKEAWKPSYRKFFERRLRELLNFGNSPLRLLVEER